MCRLLYGDWESLTAPQNQSYFRLFECLTQGAEVWRLEGHPKIGTASSCNAVGPRRSHVAPGLMKASSACYWAAYPLAPARQELCLQK